MQNGSILARQPRCQYRIAEKLQRLKDVRVAANGNESLAAEMEGCARLLDIEGYAQVCFSRDTAETRELAVPLVAGVVECRPSLCRSRVNNRKQQAHLRDCVRACCEPGSPETTWRRGIRSDRRFGENVCEAKGSERNEGGSRT